MHILSYPLPFPPPLLRREDGDFPLLLVLASLDATLNLPTTRALLANRPLPLGFVNVPELFFAFEEEEIWLLGMEALVGVE